MQEWYLGWENVLFREVSSVQGCPYRFRVFWFTRCYQRKNLGDATTRRVKQIPPPPALTATPTMKGSPSSTLEMVSFNLAISDTQNLARTPLVNTTFRMWCWWRAPVDCGCSTSMETSVCVVVKCLSCGINYTRCVYC